MPDLVTLALAKSFTRKTALGQGAVGIKGDKGDPGIAKEIELQSDGSFIQYRYVGDAAWINVVSLTALKGDKGNDGLKGDDGRDAELPEFRVEENVLQYKFPSQTDEDWVAIYTFEFVVDPVDLSPIESRLDDLEEFNTDKIGDTTSLSTTSKQVVGSLNELHNSIQNIEVGIGDIDDYISSDDDNKIVKGSDEKLFVAPINLPDTRDFTSNPIDLETEITGILPIGNVNVSSIQSQIDTANTNISEHDTRITTLEEERRFNWRGQFQLGNTYNTYDVVSAEDGNDYIAIMDNVVLSPPSLGWEIFLLGGSGDSTQRDFTENPINLESEVMGILPLENIDSSLLLSSDDIIVTSDETPAEPSIMWLQPVGKMSLGDVIGVNSPNIINIYGSQIRDVPPEDTSNLWFVPI